jgi:hypothetical protein
MPAEQAEGMPGTHTGLRLGLTERIPGMRVLTWYGDDLYAAKGYELLCGRFLDGHLNWKRLGGYRPPVWRSLTRRTRLSFRLVRDGFHALAVLSSGHLIGAVPGAIVTLAPGESDCKITHRITRGTRPLHITATLDGRVFFGEYFDNAGRDEVHIYGSVDQGSSWEVAYTFPRGAIRHIHNIVYDRWENCLWILTGDDGDECRILRTSCDLTKVETVMSGNQQARAVAAVPAAEGLYFASDTPLEANHVHHLSRPGQLAILTDLPGSSIEGCRVGDSIFFTTMVEPSEVNCDQFVRIFGGRSGRSWKCLLAWEKDRWPMRFFQYGNAFLPSGENPTSCLAVSTVAVESDDLMTNVYRVEHSGG